MIRTFFSLLMLILLIQGLAGADATNLEVQEIQFDPVGRGRNRVAVNVRNLTDQPQVFAIHIQTRSPNVGRGGVGWGTAFFDDIAPQKEKWCHFVFAFQGDVIDESWVRLRFYSPSSVDSYEFEDYFLERKFFGSELEHRKPDTRPVQPAAPELADPIMHRFKKIQALLQKEEYEAVWNAFTEDYQKAEFLGQFEVFEAMLGGTPFGWEREQFLNLEAKDVGKKGDLLLLRAALGDDAVWRSISSGIGTSGGWMG